MDEEYYRSEYSTRALVRDLWRMLKGRRKVFSVASFLELTSRLVWLYPAYALAELVNELTGFVPGQSLEEVWWIMTLWTLASLWHYIADQTAQYLGYQVAERVALEAQLKTLDHLLLLDLTWHEKENTGNKLKRIQRGGEGIDRLVRIWFDNCIGFGVTFFGMVPILFAFDRTVGFATLFFLITFFLFSSFLTKRAGRAAHIVSTGEEDLQGIAFETINNVRSVKVLGMQAGLVGIIRDHIHDLFGKIQKRIRCFRTRETILQFWAQIFRIGITFFITFGILRGMYEVGFLILFYTYFNYIWESIDRFSHMTLDVIIARYGVSRMMEILTEPIRIDQEEEKSDFPKDWDKVKIQNLSFAYGRKSVLRDISFEIKRGERIGIVGVSGTGKSTLFKLLLKEHEHYDGEILIGGVSLRDIRRSAFFRHSAVVLQDTEVFNFKLRDNITLANPKRAHNEALLKKAIEIAYITDFIEKLPDGIDTYIGEKGIKLSGGEKQRVGIARAVFKQPDLLFLDEATSHLDSESEQKIRDSLHRFFQTVTAVVIAHRLSTIKDMDRILVLEDGKIVEEGSFDALYTKRGRFYALWEKQKL